MKIYQVCHDEASEMLCSPTQDIINVRDINYPQLAETRAFFHALLYDSSEYIGFTPYRHNEKFVKCIRVERIRKELINKCFENPDVKVIAFDPTDDFMKHIKLYFNLMDDFIIDFIKDVFNHDFKVSNPVTPLCNAFIMEKSEFMNYMKFLYRFLGYLDSNGFSIGEYAATTPVSDRNRGWAYFCEMLLSFYLNYEYTDFKTAFIDRAEEITIR